MDSVGEKRNAFQNKTQMTLNQILSEIDGFTDNEGVVVIAATNMFKIVFVMFNWLVSLLLIKFSH